MRKRAATLFLAGVLAGCSTGECRVGQKGILAQLYFGRSMHDGRPIGEPEWRDFLARSVTPKFPDGLTVLDGYGQWRSATGIIGHEPSTVVVIATDGSTDTAIRLAQIREEYRARFAQDSVGLVSNASCNSF